ncbi:MAG: molybdenum cofactor biosynthesis protein MoaE [Dehalococcoidia bacterium]|nr:molybdenum cofactor biosynthesis protein MoaE [Dehalococcoidia bacterium]
MIRITRQVLDEKAITSKLKLKVHGAVVTFAGTTRLYSDGKKVRMLEYEAYEPMATKKLREIEADMRKKWKLEDAVIFHRLGNLEVGEVSVFIAAASEHRAEAFDACRFAIEEIKEKVPIWKKEHWVNGKPHWVRADANWEVKIPEPKP